VLDSASNLGLSPVDERNFIRDLSRSVNLLLYSLHATKEGGFAGSNTLLHDATVMIECSQHEQNKFSAIVRKNRCGEIGKDILSFVNAPNGAKVFPIAANFTGK
jgi:predicted ATP-dependent serine protease